MLYDEMHVNEVNGIKLYNFSLSVVPFWFHSIFRSLRFIVAFVQEEVVYEPRVTVR